MIGACLVALLSTALAGDESASWAPSPGIDLTVGTEDSRISATYAHVAYKNPISFSFNASAPFDTSSGLGAFVTDSKPGGGLKWNATLAYDDRLATTYDELGEAATSLLDVSSVTEVAWALGVAPSGDKVAEAFTRWNEQDVGLRATLAKNCPSDLDLQHPPSDADLAGLSSALVAARAALPPMLLADSRLEPGVPTSDRTVWIERLRQVGKDAASVAKTAGPEDAAKLKALGDAANAFADATQKAGCSAALAVLDRPALVPVRATYASEFRSVMALGVPQLRAKEEVPKAFFMRLYGKLSGSFDGVKAYGVAPVGDKPADYLGWTLSGALGGDFIKAATPRDWLVFQASASVVGTRAVATRTISVCDGKPPEIDGKTTSACKDALQLTADPSGAIPTAEVRAGAVYVRDDMRSPVVPGFQVSGAVTGLAFDSDSEEPAKATGTIQLLLFQDPARAKVKDPKDITPALKSGALVRGGVGLDLSQPFDTDPDTKTTWSAYATIGTFF